VVKVSFGHVQTTENVGYINSPAADVTQHQATDAIGRRRR